MVKHLNDENFKAEVSAPGVSVVDFWAAWCGPCRAMGPQVEAFAADYEGRVRVYKLDVEEAQSTAAEMGIVSIPTVIFFKDGVPVDKSVGLTSKAVLAQKADALL